MDKRRPRRRSRARRLDKRRPRSAAGEPSRRPRLSGGAPFGQAPAAASGAPFGQAPAAEASREQASVAADVLGRRALAKRRPRRRSRARRLDKRRPRRRRREQAQPAAKRSRAARRLDKCRPRRRRRERGSLGRTAAPGPAARRVRSAWFQAPARGGGMRVSAFLRLGRLCDLGGEVVLFGVARASPAALAALRRTEVRHRACGPGGDDGGVAGARVAHAALCDAGQSDAALSRCAATCTAGRAALPAGAAAAVALEDRFTGRDGSPIPRAALAAAAAPSSFDQLGSRAAAASTLTAAEAAPAPARRATAAAGRPPCCALRGLTPSTRRLGGSDAAAVLYQRTRPTSPTSAPAAYYDKACGRWILPDTGMEGRALNCCPPLRAPRRRRRCAPGLAPAGQSAPRRPRRARGLTVAMAVDPLAAE